MFENLLERIHEKLTIRSVLYLPQQQTGIYVLISVFIPLAVWLKSEEI